MTTGEDRTKTDLQAETFAVFVSPFCRQFFCHSSVVKYTSSLFQ